MKILLIRPKPHKETIGLQHVMICEPLELEYISSYLAQDGHRITIIDMILERRSLERIIQEEDPDLVGITAYISHVKVVKEYAAVIKEQKPQCRVAVGGVHAEVVPEDLEDKNIDYIIRANGLKAFRQLANNLYFPGKLQHMEELWGKDKGPCIKEQAFDFPFPDRTKVEKYRRRYYYMFHNPCALMKTSFGCPYACSFCFCRQITDRKYYTRPLNDVIEELKTIDEDEIYIVDDDFLVDRDRVMEFCRELKKQGIQKKYLIYGRADFIAQNEDVLKEFSQWGLRSVIIGLESCKEEELLKYNKRSSVMMNEKAIAILKKYGIECYAALILGTDWNRKDFDNLYRWLKKLDLMFINLQPFTPLPGTDIFDSYKDQLLIPREDYEKWDLAHLTLQPVNMSVSQYYCNMIGIYYKITMRPKNILKMVKKYGFKQCLRLFVGSGIVSWQYMKKMIRGKQR